MRSQNGSPEQFAVPKLHGRNNARQFDLAWAITRALTLPPPCCLTKSRANQLPETTFAAPKHPPQELVHHSAALCTTSALPLSIYPVSPITGDFWFTITKPSVARIFGNFSVLTELTVPRIILTVAIHRSLPNARGRPNSRGIVYKHHMK